MENYRTSAHSRFDIKYHFVWVTKYRKGVLIGAVGKRVREIVREVCRTHDIEILQGAVSRDHVHAAVLPAESVSQQDYAVHQGQEFAKAHDGI